MTHLCAWCWQPGAKVRVAFQTDHTLEAYSWFCNTAHHANWSTNQERPVMPVTPPTKALGIREIVKEINLRGWLVLNLFQFSHNQWQANLQKRQENGGTTNIFTEFAQGDNMEGTLRACLDNAIERDAHMDKSEKKVQTTRVRSGQKTEDRISEATSEKLVEAMDGLLRALERKDGTGSDSGKDDL